MNSPRHDAPRDRGGSDLPIGGQQGASTAEEAERVATGTQLTLSHLEGSAEQIEEGIDLPAPARTDAPASPIRGDGDRSEQRGPTGSPYRSEREPDGVQTEREPDGVRTEREPDGVQTEREPDGVRTEREPDGVRTKGEPDGVQTFRAGRDEAVTMAQLRVQLLEARNALAEVTARHASQFYTLASASAAAEAPGAVSSGSLEQARAHPSFSDQHQSSGSARRPDVHVVEERVSVQQLRVAKHKLALQRQQLKVQQQQLEVEEAPRNSSTTGPHSLSGLRASRPGGGTRPGQQLSLSHV